jgi:hypothetical protein
MKTKKSKIVALLLLATMILTMNVQSIHVYADDIKLSACSHDPRISDIKEYIGVNQGALGHCNVTKITYICIKCYNYSYTEEIKTPIEVHSTSRTDWHSGSRHYVERSCLECSFSSLESWACPGNPCINPDRIILED